MAEASFSLAVENLGALLIQMADILGRVEGPATALKDELERMQHFLREAVEREGDDPTMRDWISQLREVALDAEDAIQAFAYLPNNPDRVQEEIQAIRVKLQRIMEMNTGFGNVQPLPMPMMRTSPWQNEEGVVGVEEIEEFLLSQAILDRRTGLSIVGIVGMIGIGKTTLARKLFNHASVAGRFDQQRAWIMISKEFDIMEIFKQLIQQLQVGTRRERMEGLQTGRLQILLTQCLLNSPYFIVLDDVKEYAHWEALQRVFPDQGNASRVVITSRNHLVTRQAHFVHEMQHLHPTRSWELFLRTIYFRRVDVNLPEHLEIIGRRIWRECHNLPVAVIEAGRQLVGRRSVAQWNEVLNTMSFGEMIFESSYHELPAMHKLCFLCLGFFRENAIIRAEKLVQIWIAGGMVSQREQMEDTARSYLDNLISRSMVRVDDKTKDDRVKSCHIYEVFHKPAIRKAENEIGLEILRDVGVSRPIHKPRHRAIYCSRENTIHSVNRDNYLRSLFFNGGGNFDGRLSYWNNFQLLKILDFEGFGLQEFPNMICTLVGLRYLGLRNNYITKLPETLGSLENLKVLDIALNFAVVVPNVIWRIKGLRHLYMSEIICIAPLNIQTLKNLQTLTYISVDTWTTYTRSSLQMLTSLRKLGIEELNEYSDVSTLFMSLARLQNLVCLNLKGSQFDRMPSLNEFDCLVNLTQLRLDGLLATLPRAHNFPPNLYYLTLVNSSLEEDPMPVLRELPKLLYLKLQKAYSGDEMVISLSGFTNLQVLRMGYLLHLRNVQVEEGAMHRLERFEISNCPRLENPPRRARIMS